MIRKAPEGGDAPALAVHGLTVRAGGAVLIHGVDLQVARAATTALVGCSGAGKTTVARAVAGLWDPARVDVTGGVQVAGRPQPAPAGMDRGGWRGRLVGTLFQQPWQGIHPHLTVGEQVAEVFRHHGGLAHQAAHTAAVDLLAQVGLPQAAARARGHLHQLSGGMAQRAALAMALAGGPLLLVADEPTASLDPLAADQVLAALERAQQRWGLGVLLITHDLLMARGRASQVAVLLDGTVVEAGPAERVLRHPAHPHTWLLAAAADLAPAGAGAPDLGAWLAAAVAAGAAVPRPSPGCSFRGRCWLAAPACQETPPWVDVAEGHRVRCHRWDQLPRGPA